jgi:AcrR family transcriptional regulator
MRETILNKATQLFLDLGFKSVTMDDIATEMGISKKTIYTHFKNKSVLVKASTDILFLRICTGIDGVRQENQNPIVELYSMKQYVMKHMKSQNSSAQFQLQKYYPAVFAEMRSKQYDYMQDCVVENLNKGLKMGLYRENLDVEFASRIYFLGMVGIKDNDMFPAKQFPMITLMEKYLEYHLRGIVTQKGLKKLTETIENYTPNDI